MKKSLIALVLACLLLVPTVLGYAEGTLDLSAYSDTALLELLDQVQAEVVSRRIQKTAKLQAGHYVGGRDIPVGSYTLTYAGVEGQNDIVWLRSVNDPEDDYPSKLYEFVSYDEGFTAFVVIEEGDTLYLPCPYTLTVYGGLVFE